MKMIFRERAEFSAVREDEIIFRRGGCPKKGGFFAGISLAYVVCRLRLRLHRDMCRSGLKIADGAG